MATYPGKPKPKSSQSGAIERSFRRLQDFAGKLLDPSYELLEKTVLVVAGIDPELPEEHRAACKGLQGKLEKLTLKLFQRAETEREDGKFQARVKEVNAVAEEIKKFLKVETKAQRVGTIVHYEQTLETVEKLHRKLDTAIHWFSIETILDVQQEVSLLRSDFQTMSFQASFVPSEIPAMDIPTKPSIFYGRDDLVKEIVQLLLKKETCRIPILGPGGIGKTSVAAAIIDDDEITSKYNKHRLFVRCEHILTAEGVVMSLARSLGLSDQGNVKGSLLAYLRSRGSPILLILDNLETAWDTEDQANVESLLVSLADCPDLSLIVTMRGTMRPGEVRWTSLPSSTLDTLDSSAGREIWMDIAHNSDERLDELLGLLDGLPLAITLLAYRGQLSTPTELIQMYKEKIVLMKRGRADRLHSLAVSIELSLTSPTMQAEPDAVSLMSLLSLLPNGLQLAEFKEVFPSMTNATTAALAIQQVALVVKDGAALRVLAPIREFMQQQYPPSGPGLMDLERHFMRLTNRANELESSTAGEAFKILSTSFPNTDAVLLHSWTRMAPLHSDLFLEELVDATVNAARFPLIYNYGDCSPLLSAGIATLVQRNDDGSRRNLPRLLQSLGDCLYSQERYVEAVDKLTKARTFFELAGDSSDAAQCMRSIGEILRIQGHFEEAAAVLDVARTTLEGLGDHLGAAKCALRLGAALQNQNQYDRAAVLLAGAIATFREFRNRRGEAQCLTRMGDILKEQQQYDEARTVLEEAQKLFRGLGTAVDMSDIKYDIAAVLSAQDRYDEAIAVLEQAKIDFEALKEQKPVAICTYGLGVTFFQAGRPAEAVQNLEEARALYDTLGLPHNSAACTETMAKVMYAREWYLETATLLRQARAGYQKVGTPRKAAQCAVLLSEVLVKQKQYGDAVPLLREAIAQYEALGDRTEAATRKESLGCVLVMDGAFEEAAPVFEEAKVEFETTGNVQHTAQCMEQLANILFKRGDYTGSTVLWKEAYAGFDAIPNQLRAARCLQQLGIAFSMQKLYDEAAINYEAAKAMREVLGDIEGAADSAKLLGGVYLAQGMFKECCERTEDARAKFEEIGDKQEAAECIQQIGTALLRLGLNDEAGVKLKEARASFEALGDTRAAEGCTLALATALVQKRQYEDCLSMLKEALEKSNSLANNGLFQAECTVQSGLCLEAQGRYEEAETKFHQARAAFIALGETRQTAECSLHLAAVMFEQRQFEDSVTHYKEALAIFASREDFRIGAAICRRQMGTVLAMLGKYDEGAAMLNEAKAGYEALRDRTGRAECLKMLGMISEDRGEYDEALKMLREARDEFKVTVGDGQAVTECDMGIGYALGKQGRFIEEAIAVLRDALAGFEELGLSPGADQCRMWLNMLQPDVPTQADPVVEAEEANDVTETRDRPWYAKIGCLLCL